MVNKEFNLKEYKEKIINSRIKKRIVIGLTVFIFLLLLNILFFYINIWLLLLLILPNLIFIIFCKTTFDLLKCNNITIGEIVDVRLENFDDAPRIVVKIKYSVQGKEYFKDFDISCWGDNDGEEESVKKWYLEEKNKYLRKKLPLLYNEKRIDKVIVYFKDILKNEGVV